MKFPRFSLASIGFLILVLAIDFAVIRIAFRSPSFEGCATFALLLLPMFDALMIALYRLRRPERRSARSIGFFIAGTVAIFVVFVSCLVAPDTALGLLRAIGRPIALASLNGLTRLFGNAAMQSLGATDSRCHLRAPVPDHVLLLTTPARRSPGAVGRSASWVGRADRGRGT